MKREDFEIFEVVGSSGQKYYCFNVEYFGFYRAKSYEDILVIKETVQQQVKDKLAEIERLNKEYYARLALEEIQRAKSLKENRKQLNDMDKSIRALNPSECIRKAHTRAKFVYKLMSKGLSNREICEKHNVPMRSLGRLRYVYEHKKPCTMK